MTRKDVGAILAIALAAACSYQPAGAVWDLWPSPDDNTEVLDQQQTQTNTDFFAQGSLAECYAVGQQFVPSGSSVWRIDLRMGDQEDSRPGVFKLWRWNTDRPTTTAQTPLFQDTVSLAGAHGDHLIVFFPKLSVTPGQTYYFEVSSAAREAISVASTYGPTDAYSAGKAWVNCWFPDDDPNDNQFYDLWFKVYGPPQGMATPPTFSGSDPSLPWFAPPASGSVDKTAYYNRIKTFVDYVRCAEQSCGVENYRESMEQAFLYKASCMQGACNETYAQDAVRMLNELYDYEFCQDVNPPCNASNACTCDASYGTFNFEEVGAAYSWLQNSPSVTTADRNRIRCQMVDSGKKHWPNREAGAHGRPLASALMYLLATQFWGPFSGASECPNITFTQQEHDDWYSYAEGDWNYFWNNRAQLSDSAGYVDNIVFPTVVEYAYFSGRDALVWGPDPFHPDAGFKKLIDDLYQRISPLGADGNYGEVSDAFGGGVGTGLIHLFEKAATKYNDPKYKWMAHQIYKSSVTRACDAPPSSDSMYLDFPSLAWAYVWANDAISDAPPAAQGESLGANQTATSATNWSMGSAGQPVGQTFLPTDTPLVRFDVKINSNNNNTSPGTIKLWIWNTDYATTIAQTPLYQDSVDLTASNVVRSFYPFLDVTVGAKYYMEFSRSPKFTLGGSPNTTSPALDFYVPGKLRVNGAEVNYADLWFKTYSLTKNGSSFNTRLEGKRRPYSQWGTPPQMFEFGANQTADKLTLRSGYDPSALWAQFNLTVEGYDHGHIAPASLVSMSDDGSWLYASTAFPYWFQWPRQLNDQSISLAKRYTGGSFGSEGLSTSIGRFVDYRQATVAWIDWSDVYGWGTQQERRLLFAKDRFLWVRDSYTFPSVTSAAAGNVWHAGDVSPGHGVSANSAWYDIYYRQPLNNVWEQKNPERYLSVFFPNSSSRGLEVAEFRESSYLPLPTCPTQPTGACEALAADCRNSPPYVLYQRWKGNTTANQVTWMDTVLVPHGPPAGVAPAIQVLYDDHRNIALQIIVNGETWTVVDNPDGNTISVPNVLTTNARYLMARTKSGLANYVLTFDASTVNVPPGINLTWPVRTSVEIGGY